MLLVTFDWKSLNLRLANVVLSGVELSDGALGGVPCLSAFALFDLVGLQLSPRIRDLGRITLARLDPRSEVEARFPHAGPLLTRRINWQLIAENWDEMLRLAASLKYGHVTASLIVGKLSRADRQNRLAAVLKEYGLLRRTIYAALHLSREDYRRKISRQLNKGESVHALKRDVFYANEGAISRRHLQQQTEQAWCLTLATNGITTWTTEYLGLAVDHLRAEGRRVDPELLAHVSPAQSDNIGLFGTITVDIDAELARLDPTGHRAVLRRRVCGCAHPKAAWCSPNRSTKAGPRPR